MIAQFTFHPERCVGCGACVIACINENGIDVEEKNPYRLLKKNEYEDGEQIEIIHFTHSCMHCKESPCEKECPKGCFTNDKGTGIVVLNNETCIGCKACARVCPYEAIQFGPNKKASKCNGCLENLKKDRLPACVMSCPRKAITIDEKNEVLVVGRESLLKELNEYNRRKQNV